MSFGAALVQIETAANETTASKTKSQYLKHHHNEKEELAPSEERLQTVEKNLNDLSMQQKFFEYRKARQNEGWLKHFL